MQGTTIQIGTRVSYEDMANPRREGTLVAENNGTLAVLWDDADYAPVKSEAFDAAFHTTVTKTMLERAIERVEKAGGRSAGWNVLPATRTVWQQATTGMLHLRRNCGVTSRTRYSHFEVAFDDERRAHSPRCAKCWDGFTPPPAVDPHDLELAPALLDELGIDDRINADAAALETLLDDDRDDVAIAKALAVIVTTPTIRAFLETNDPQALEQARTALGAEPPVRRLGHVDAHTLMRAENTGREVDGVSPTAATAELDRRGLKRLAGPDYVTNDDGSEPVDAHTGARLEL